MMNVLKRWEIAVTTGWYARFVSSSRYEMAPIWNMTIDAGGALL